MSSRLDVGLACRRVHDVIGDAAVVTSLGTSSWAWFSAGDRPLNLYTQGSMGLASSIGLGLALARPDRAVVSMEGEGSMLMNLGSLATIAVARPPNLTVIVWDDRAYTTTGGQPNHAAHGVDVAGIAAAAGLRAERISDADALAEAVERAVAERDGPRVIVVDAAPPASAPQRSRLPIPVVKHRLMEVFGTCRCHPAGEAGEAGS